MEVIFTLILIFFFVLLPVISVFKIDTCKKCRSKNTELDGYYEYRSSEGSYNGSNYKFKHTGYKCNECGYKHKKLFK